MEIDKYLQEQLSLINDNSNGEFLMLLSQQICGKLSYQYNYNGDVSDLVKKVYQILVNYQNKSINLNDATLLLQNEISNVINLNNTASNGSYSRQSNSFKSKQTNIKEAKKDSKSAGSTIKASSNEEKKNEEEAKEEKTVVKETSTVSSASRDVVIDNDMDTINQISQRYKIVQDTVSEAEIKIDNVVQEPGIEEIKGAASELASELISEFSSVASSLTDTWSRLTEVDESIPDLSDSEGKEFDAFLTATNAWKSSKKLHKAGLDFFSKQGCKIDGNTAIYEDDKKKYIFDVKNGNLSVRNKSTGAVTSVKVNYLIPEETTNYRDLNTITYIISNDYELEKQKFSSESILILPVYKVCKDSKEKTRLINSFSDATEFINKVTKTDVKKTKNTVMGGSKYGSFALQTAAKSDTYDSVVCVNNALIVLNENGISAGKEKFSNYSDVSGLNGKDIYFVSTANDPNTSKRAEGGSSWPSKNCGVKQSYFYTGLKLLLEKCPNARVHVITNSTQVKAYSDLSKKYSNYDYNSGYWNKFYLGNYTEHYYEGVVKNIVSSSILI